jgi:serpin B
VGWIDDVYHAARVDVDERGTEASAATAVVLVQTAAPQVTLAATRSYLLMIVERKSQAILLLGSVGDPRSP